MARSLRKKMASRRGFTLLEMLACVLTMILLALICTVGLNMAMKSYNESVFESSSQMLESMINTSVGDVLRYSYGVSDSGGGNGVSFSNRTFDVSSGRLVLDAEGHLMLQKDSTPESAKVLLVGTGVYIESMYISDFVLEYDVDTCVYTGSYKIKSDKTGQEKTVSFIYKSFLESL